MAGWRWFQKWWRVPVLLILGVVGYILWKRWSKRPPIVPFKQLKKELEAIAAGTEVEKMKAELGHREALSHIDDKYAKELQAMDLEQREESSRLRADPEALTRFIVRGRT